MRHVRSSRPIHTINDFSTCWHNSNEILWNVYEFLLIKFRFSYFFLIWIRIDWKTRQIVIRIGFWILQYWFWCSVPLINVHCNVHWNIKRWDYFFFWCDYIHKVLLIKSACMWSGFSLKSAVPHEAKVTWMNIFIRNMPMCIQTYIPFYFMHLFQFNRTFVQLLLTKKIGVAFVLYGNAV